MAPAAAAPPRFPRHRCRPARKGHRQRPCPRHLCSSLLVLCGLMAAVPAFAAEPDQPAKQDQPDEGDPPAAREQPAKPPAPENGALKVVNSAHRVLSRGLETTATEIDRFFATEEALEEATGSFFKVRLDNWWIEREGAKAVPDIRANLKLPRTQRRFNLLIESDPEREDRTEEDLPDSPEEQAEENNLSLALEGVGELKRWEVRPALGLKVTLPVELFSRIRFIRRQKVGLGWSSRMSNTLAWFRTEGVIGRVDHDFDRPLGERFLFRVGSSYRWSRDEEVQSFDQRLILFQTLREARRIAYEVGVFSDDKLGPWVSQDYYARIRLRRRIYRQWLFAEIQPQVRFPRHRSFNHVFSLLFRLEAVFGERALYPSEQVHD